MIKCVDDIIVDMEGENWMNLFMTATDIMARMEWLTM